MRVLGIDPGLTRCGLGVIDGRPGRPPELVGVDVIRTPADLDVARRLCRIEEQIEAWLVEHRPDTVAVERVFAQHNVQTVMGTAQAAGVAMLIAARRGIPVALHTPSEVKAAITGSGRADKAQVTAMVTRILRLGTPPKPADAADALALAICHVWRGGITDRYESARQSAAADAAVQRQRAALRRSRSAAAPSRPSPATGVSHADNDSVRRRASSPSRSPIANVRADPPAGAPAQQSTSPAGPPLDSTSSSARRVS
jgi:crossover junction endodeoxyribonuclease RuvC